VLSQFIGHILHTAVFEPPLGA